MTLQEAIQLADEAEKQMYCSKYPLATIALAKELRKLQRELRKEAKQEGTNAEEQ